MKRRLVLPLVTAVALAGLVLPMAACSTTYDRRDPTGEVFPTVVGESLAGEPVELPTAFRGAPVVLLVGYAQETQFDLDRWLLGLTDSGARIAVREVPTIPGLAPRAFAGWIDSGMRRGIPEEDWGAVVTLYADAAPVARFTGNRDGLPGRVLLLDAEGRVVFFHDRGYGVGALKQLLAAAAALSPSR